jgi:hypothetical protein
VAEDCLDLQRRAGKRSILPRRSPLPEEFGTAAVELARKHGLYRTARTLPIDYLNLRKSPERRGLRLSPVWISRKYHRAGTGWLLRGGVAGRVEWRHGLEPTPANLAEKPSNDSDHAADAHPSGGG